MSRKWDGVGGLSPGTSTPYLKVATHGLAFPKILCLHACFVGLELLETVPAGESPAWKQKGL